MMTRKDYIKTAEILNVLWHDTVLAKVEQRDTVELMEKTIIKFTEMFLDDNPNFDTDIFIRAVTKR
jgi:hypothetical protein